MQEILLLKIVESAESGILEATTRPALAAYLKVKPPRISALARAMAGRRLIRRKKVRLNGTGRLQLSFLPTEEGRSKAAGIAARLAALGDTKRP